MPHQTRNSNAPAGEILKDAQAVAFSPEVG